MKNLIRKIVIVLECKGLIELIRYVIKNNILVFFGYSLVIFE